MSGTKITRNATVGDLVELYEKVTLHIPSLGDRSLRGIAYLIGGRVHELGPDTYLVDGHDDRTYEVSLADGSCECPDFVYGNAPIWNGTPCCKHQLAALAHKAISQRAMRRLARCRASRLSAYRG
jgi:hypothetical protein